MENRTEGYIELRITDVKVYRFDIPMLKPFRIATMCIESARNVLIKIETNAGIDGWGEGSSFHAIVGETQLINFAAAKELKGLIIGKNPLEISSIVTLLDMHLPHNTTIKSAFDMALYDISAKAAGMPLYMFLNRRKRRTETDYTIGLGTPKDVATKALSIVKDLDFNILKVKVGLDYEENYQRLKKIRDAVGPSPVIRIDANQGWWDRMFAVRCLNAFERFNIEFCEQPCLMNDNSALRFIGSNTSIPIMADESVFSPSNILDLVCQDVTPYFNIKLSKTGGINNAIKVGHIAESSNRACMIGCMSESRLGLTAALHFALSNEIIQFFDLDSFYEHAEDPIIGGMTVDRGIISIPDEPGIGAYLDPIYMKKIQEIT